MGHGRESEALSELVRIVSSVVTWLEDLWCYSMEGIDVLEVAHMNTQLLYQT